MGMAASMGSILLSGGAKGKRYIFPHGEVMIHQPSGGGRGTSADLEIMAVQMQKTKEPIVLTVNGKAQLVVQDVESYQALLEAKERMDAIAGIKRGLEAMQSAKGKSADKYFAEFFAEHNIADD